MKITSRKNKAEDRVYPSVQEQLDMLWHSMDSNQFPKSEPFYSTIKEIKLNNPKTESMVKIEGVTDTEVPPDTQV